MKLFRSCLLLLSFVFVHLVHAQEVEVPGTMEFAGLKLKLDEDARSLIGKNVWLLRKNTGYFNTTFERFELYRPLIEQALAAEGLPDDFKYLAVQESSLVSDAVSTSNAVGFWQFKKASAMEVGMRVDNDIDERKHILVSTRGAAKYMKRNNFYLNNWLGALLSHYAGLGGARTLLPADWAKATKVDIDKNTHWYILKFLAHKVAFQEELGRNPQRSLVLLEYKETNGKSIKQIAHDLDLTEEDLLTYNKWLSCSRIPGDKSYTVIVPAPASQLTALIAKTGSPFRPIDPGSEAVASINSSPVATSGAVFPVLQKKRQDRMYSINGKLGIQAKAGESFARLADLGDISIEKLRRFNDLAGNERPVAGQVYYLKRKRNKAAVEEHVAVEGETLWEISQRYGIKLKTLLRKNRMQKGEKLVHGRVLRLRYARSAHTPVEIRDVPKPAATMVAQYKPKPAVKSPAKVLTSDQPKADMPVAPVVNESPKVADSQPKPVVTEKSVQPTASAPVEKKEETPAVEKVAIYTPPTTPASEPVAPSSGKTHQVEQGQTLYAISKLYGVTVAQLRSWNNLAGTDGVKLGQTLIVDQVDSVAAPEQKPVAIEFTEYVVQPGDTVYKISKAYGVTVEEILTWNGKTDVTLALGEVLKVKKK